MKTIIALTGPKHVGKTSLANLLSSEYGYEKTSFAEPMKCMLRALLEYQSTDTEMIDRIVYGDLKEVATPYLADRSFRHAAETLGSEWRDLMHLHLWTNIWRTHVESSPRNRFVIDDMRFLHEAETVRKYPGSVSRIIRLERDGCGPGKHPSAYKYTLIEANFVIRNDMSKYDMLLRLEDLLGDLL